MSNVSGTISVNVEFRDTTTSSGVQSLKTVTLRDATEYTSGKVAIVTGTVGTSSVSVSTSPTTYRDASGAFVSFANVDRVVCKASRPCNFEDGGTSIVGQTLCVFSTTGTPDLDIQPGYSSGTASYTLVLYGT